MPMVLLHRRYDFIPSVLPMCILTFKSDNRSPLLASSSMIISSVPEPYSLKTRGNWQNSEREISSVSGRKPVRVTATNSSSIKGRYFSEEFLAIPSIRPKSISPDSRAFSIFEEFESVSEILMSGYLAEKTS